MLQDRLAALRRRTRLAQATRVFFTARGYLEVETPYAVRTPGEEVHLRAFRTERENLDGSIDPLWLHTSPEFAMKRLLAAGAGSIFQLARVWRNGEGSPLHRPEFTMLEWYTPHQTLHALAGQTEQFLRAVLAPTVTCRSITNTLDQPFERLTVADAFACPVGCDILVDLNDAPSLARRANARLRDGETWEDLFFRLMLEHVEPHLGRARPTFLTHWPAPLAALARRDPTDPRVALRFELFLCGIELANAFEELTDPVEQRARFVIDRNRRSSLAPSFPDADWPLDEDFLAALASMPDAAGIALGFDRLAMVAAEANVIGDILWLG